MGLAVLLFVAVVGVILFIASRIGGRKGDRAVAMLFLLPTVLMLAVGLVYPGVRTIVQSFFDAAGTSFIGLGNYETIVTSSEQLTVLRNTMLWVVLTPFVATLVGLLYAILVDKSRFESAAKALIFLPMAISFVGASIIWKFVYEYRPVQGNVHQIGLLNQVIVWLGGTPQQWLVNSPLNTFFLVVVTTIGIGTLKVFDIVRTMTGGQFDTSVVANEFYSQSFRSNNQGLGAALATLLFILVIPIVAYNIRQMRASEAR